MRRTIKQFTGKFTTHVQLTDAIYPYVPPPEIGEVEVMILTKDERSTAMGLILFADDEEDFTMIMEVKDYGLIPEWNALYPSQRLEKGDRIISVNGCGGMGQIGYSAILAELRKVGQMEMIVKRARPVSLENVEQWPTTGRRNSIRGSVRQEPIGKTVLEDIAPHLNWVFKLPHVLSAECKANQCTACLKILNIDREVLQLSCGHCFHLECAKYCLQPSETISEVVCPEGCNDLHVRSSPIVATRALAFVAAVKMKQSKSGRQPKRQGSRKTVAFKRAMSEHVTDEHQNVVDALDKIKFLSNSSSSEGFALNDDLPDGGIEEKPPSSQNQHFLKQKTDRSISWTALTSSSGIFQEKTSDSIISSGGQFCSVSKGGQSCAIRPCILEARKYGTAG